MANAEYRQVPVHDKPCRDAPGDGQELLARPVGHRRCIAHALGTNKAALVNSVLLVVHVVVVVMFVLGLRPTCNDLLYSPLSRIVSHEVRPFITDEDHLWTGPPNPVVEENWHQMLLGFDVRVTEDELKRLGRLDKAVRLNDERGGYVALINVFHELHCLKLIRWSLYPDHFYPNSTAAETAERERHRDHCLNYVRQSAMCHADVGLSTWHWRPNDSMPHADMMPHTCRAWAAIDDWAKDRRVDMYQPGLLVHPQFGAEFPAGGGANEDDGGS
ncbi:hypothetical protein OCS_00683 [Ophiocordyceps sinensis CO18]|uniref:Tat pathway signal sequence n=1 Tax=Ophiocordyceps sinensis (strain Co18 / CGMCC 3.14243) TaxID=911162 RepID=T5AP58_OPHSC|nr:hypothetical protein OCS_00683 [Ophiocordyceps sinensis CO18]